ncbi:MAG: helix-turn-helix domain-containing protein, partial [Gammaproteobacteria bacterium]
MFTDTAHSLKQVAATLNIPSQTLLDLISQGDLPAIKVGKRSVLIADEDLYI